MDSSTFLPSFRSIPFIVVKILKSRSFQTCSWLEWSKLLITPRNIHNTCSTLCPRSRTYQLFRSRTKHLPTDFQNYLIYCCLDTSVGVVFDVSWHKWSELLCTYRNINETRSILWSRSTTYKLVRSRMKHLPTGF